VNFSRRVMALSQKAVNMKKQRKSPVNRALAYFENRFLCLSDFFLLFKQDNIVKVMLYLFIGTNTCR